MTSLLAAWLFVALVGLFAIVLIVQSKKGKPMPPAHAFDEGSVEVGGVALRCHHCEHDRFSRRMSLLNTAGLTLLDLDWANRSATCFVCERCGFVHWFLL